MTSRWRVVCVVVGVVLFVAAAAMSFGWLHEGDVVGLALLGFACWLASTLP